MLYTNFFLSCAQLHSKDLWTIYYRYNSFKEAYFQFLSGKGFNFLNNVKKQALKHLISGFNLKDNFDFLESRGMTIITQEDETFPEPLKHIYDSPIALYCKGNLQIFKNYQNFIAVVGPRNPSFYGQKAAEYFSRELIRNGLNLVSGLAFGVDSIAHKISVENNVPTIAVLGSSLTSIYPASNNHLAQKIIETGGLLISETSPFISSQKFHFAKRNRIISGLCQSTLLVEAGKKSGGLITAASAFSQDRETYVLPNSIFEESSFGSNNLLALNRAKPIIHPNQILQDYNITPKKENKIHLNLEGSALNLYKLLTKESLTIDQIVLQTGLSYNEIAQTLAYLELKGHVTHKNFGIYQANISSL